MDRATGAVRWQVSIPSNAPRTLGGANVVLAGDVAVYGDGGIHAFDRTTGEQRWTTTASDGLPVGPMVADGNTVYVLLDNEQKMGAYDAQTGDELWLAAPPVEGVRCFGGLPLAGPDAIFIAGRDALLALRK